MAIGAQLNKQLIDVKISSAVTGLRDSLATASKINKWLQSQPDQSLISLYGYTQAEIDLVKSAFLALHKLNQIANNQATQPEQDNFFFFGDQLAGLD